MHIIKRIEETVVSQLVGGDCGFANRAYFTLPWRTAERLNRPIALVYRDNAANEQRFTTLDTCVERAARTWHQVRAQS